jgi:hypothetical protein
MPRKTSRRVDLHPRYWLGRPNASPRPGRVRPRPPHMQRVPHLEFYFSLRTPCFPPP